MSFWQLIDRTSETEFIFALFHLLLASLALFVLLRWVGRSSEQFKPPTHLLLTTGFSLFALDFALTTIYYGTNFFFDEQWNQLLIVPLSQSLAGIAALLSSAGLVASGCRCWSRRATVCTIGGCSLIGGLLLLQLILPSGSATRVAVLEFAVVATDVLVTLGVALATVLLISHGHKWRQPAPLALLLLLSSGLVHLLHLFWVSAWSNLCWHIEEHLLSFSLVTFAWALGERSPHLFDRVFVRLNLSFILLASVMILSTVGMERFQYAKLAEEHSLGLAEHLRGYLTFYKSRGEDLGMILQRPEVQRRVVVGFTELPDFQRIEVFLGGDHAVFRYAPDQTIAYEIGRLTAPPADPDRTPANEDVTSRTSFRVIRLPVFSSEGENGDRIEFYTGMQYINRHIGSYIVVIYVLFTVMVVTSIVVVGIIVRNADISIQKQHAEIEGIGRQLLQAAKLASIGELAGGVAHEINNPVTGILSTATHLIDKRRDNHLTERDKQGLQLIAEQAERISDIVSKLLTFSRQSRMELTLCDVNSVIEKAISLIEFRLKNTSVILQRRFTPDLPLVLCDANRLTEVFVNLMNNAIDAVQPAGSMTVSTGLTAEAHVYLAVSDTGTGIDSTLLQRIFDPFFTTKGPGKGTGLGLSISHGIVKAHHGEIRVESTPGQGSTFTVILPVAVSGEEHIAIA